MGYRDEAEAMHARMNALQVELDAARQRAEAAEANSADREALAARVHALVAELEALRESPPSEPTPGSPPTGFVPPKPRKVRQPSKAMSAYRSAAGWFGLSASIIVAGLYLVDLDWCGADLEAEPTEGRVRTDEPSTRRTAHVSGVVRAEELFSPRCRGFLPEAPMVVLDADQATRLTLRVTSASDTVMALRTEDGDFICDDDSAGGGNPRIETVVEAGEHRVWVGTFNEGIEADVELFVQSAPP